ncbi:RICIN domain-containing protein [Cellulomonas sp. Sa3CUA2]|uniref:RICIN domain-containing protein n=1 Tax=Cellulomonas avistercoris TaxID=2762242 RepID=A0ABR8QHL5_9CELL|nr:RICIN domain-containing protein [Cellulomonas avistercoris]MBD7919890.1 RICIN domain-containing protein [Cellulomonas avistercoris]
MHRTARRLLLAVTLCLALAGGVVTQSAPASAESNGGTRVMPLGDSITEGIGMSGGGGYRVGLWQRLAQGGYTTDFVGSGFNGPSSLWDHDHEGHSGWRIDQIDANVVNWVRTYQPRTVLLHIGTNDISQNRDLANAPNRLAGVIDKITSTSPQTDVFVATLIPVSYANSQVQSYNSAIPGIVSSRAAAGKRVHLVDMYRAVSLSDLPDGVHPNANGYDKMAAVWYAALRAVPGSIGNPSGGTSPTPTPTPTPTPSPTSTPGNGPVDTSAWYSLVNRNSGKAIDVYNLSTADGARITQWSRNGGNQQQWQFVSTGNGYYQLKSRLSGKVLDVSGNSTADGAAIQQYGSHGGNNQQFSIQTIDGYVQLIARHSGKAVEVQGASTTDGGNIVQYSDWNGSNQQWQLVPTG